MNTEKPCIWTRGQIKREALNIMVFEGLKQRITVEDRSFLCGVLTSI